MIDIKFIRDHPGDFQSYLNRRGIKMDPSEILKIDSERRHAITELQSLQQQRNDLSKEIGQARNNKSLSEKLMAQVAGIKISMESFEKKEKELTERLEQFLLHMPNIPLADVPVGKDEKSNVEVKRWGIPKTFSYPVLAHDELGEALQLMDFKAAANLSGSRFVVLKGVLAKLERALAAFMLDLHTQEFGYTEILPPFLVRDQALLGTGQLPKFADDLFRTTQGYWLIPTAEVPLTNLVAGQILDESQLPYRVTAWTPCFRSEAGAAGRDTKGMLRQHQFSKVELVSIVQPEKSAAEHERMTACAETVLERLGLPYRRVLLCSGDMSFTSQKTYDLEVWLPAQKQYREISSCSNCGDYQARRMLARFRSKGQKNTQFVHTLNGSGLAIGRTLIAVMENYQQPDGTILVPDALKPYLPGVEVIGKPR
ncbi:MAG TPA: serine--tRNA ligase [Alphaproteobacteria bacterium]|nr:serine--tRNA ligase [Alphaproteobacteria bacterium]